MVRTSSVAALGIILHLSSAFRGFLTKQIFPLSNRIYRSRYNMMETQSSDVSSEIAQKKVELSKALIDFQGDTKNEKVLEIINDLSSLNPTKNAANNDELMCGDFTATGYNFDGTQLGPDGWECTLGRLCYNLFEPLKLPVRITHVLNTLKMNPALEGEATMDYNIQTTFKTRTPECVLEGVINNTGVAWPDKNNSERLNVLFTEGTLSPAKDQDLDSWKKVFKPREPIQPSFRQRILNFVLKLMMGLNPAKEIDDNGVQCYKMTRAPKGYLDILYADDDLRISRGIKGAVVVTVRNPSL